MGAKQFGARTQRVEDAALLVGQGRFIDDIALPGMLHACFVRSPHAHARLLDVDVAHARSMPGVHAILTAADLPGPLARERMPMLVPNASIAAAKTQHCLAIDEVCYVGQTIAVVLADSRYLAEDAANAVFPDLDPLPAVSNCRDAVAPGAPIRHAGGADPPRWGRRSCRTRRTSFWRIFYRRLG